MIGILTEALIIIVKRTVDGIINSPFYNNNLRWF